MIANSRRIMPLCILTTALAVSCGKQEKVTLTVNQPEKSHAWNFKKSFYVELTKKCEDTFKSKGMERKTGQDLFMGLDCRILAQTDTGVVVEETIDALKEYDIDATGKHPNQEMAALIGR